MRRTNTAISLVSLLLPLAALGVGCGGGSADCTQSNSCTVTDPYIAPACVPAWNTEAVAASCGVFVSKSLGSDSAAGTPDKPVRSLARAIEIAGASGIVYACAEDFEESVFLPAGIALFGGLDCAQGFRYIDGIEKTRIFGAPDTIPLVLAPGEAKTRIEDVAAFAADATIASGSSIALLADHARAELTRCDLRAGDAADGAPGASVSFDPALNGLPGVSGMASCMTQPPVGTPGGAEVVLHCPDGNITLGGEGGDGGAVSSGSNELLSGGDGGKGAPNGAVGGKGEGSSPWGCTTGIGSSGQGGARGIPGAAGSGFGVLSALGYEGIHGGDGHFGLPGQGGGGAGGARGGKQICSGTPGPGASGGSGGTGGCGGKGGGGGGAGGASIALLSISSSIVLADTRGIAARGGRGGNGGDGQPGGSGGLGGSGGKGGAAADACQGGMGGKGGAGGPGGGGLGGPSIVIAHVGSAPTLRGEVSLGEGEAGGGGLGGDGDSAQNHGDPGFSAAIRPF